MLDDVQCQENYKPNCVPEEFMPFSCTVLSKALIEYAAKHLNETEETRRKGLQGIREFLKRELNFNFEIEDIVILCFLRSRKFDIKRTCDLMRKGAEFGESYLSIFDRMDSNAVRTTVESKIIGFLPYRDSKGRAIVLITCERWNPSEIKAEDVIFGAIVSLHIAGENPVNQVAGFVVIIDCKNLRMNQVISISSWMIFGIQALQRCCPCLVKEFHVVHTPIIFRTAWKIVKPLLSEKIKKRITIYKSTHWESLHRRIPPAILPEELGGHLGPYSYEHWAGDLEHIEKKYNEKVRMFMDRNEKH